MMLRFNEDNRNVLTALTWITVSSYVLIVRAWGATEPGSNVMIKIVQFNKYSAKSSMHAMGLRTKFYYMYKILKEMRFHISIYKFKIQNSATIAAFYLHIQCVCKHSLIFLQFLSPPTPIFIVQGILIWINVHMESNNLGKSF
jgi:hypothetical protein